MAEPDQILSLLQRLFPSGSAEPDWQAFAEGFSEAFGGVLCGVWCETSTDAPTAIAPPALLEEWCAFEWATGSEESYRLLQREYPLGKVTPFRADEDGGRVDRLILQPAGLARDGLVAALTGDSAGSVTSLVGVYPRWERPGLEREQAMLEAAMPWLVHAARATLVQRRSEAATSALRQSVDRLQLGVVLLDEQTRVVFANRSAASLLEAGPAPAFDAWSADAERTERVQRGLDRLLGRAEARPRMILASIDLARDGARPFEGRVRTAMLIADPAGAPVPSPDALRERYALTPAEARLAVLLSTGLSLEEAADVLGVKVGTVRTRIKQVFAKTETHRQGELVRLLLSEAPPVLDE